MRTATTLALVLAVAGCASTPSGPPEAGAPTFDQMRAAILAGKMGYWKDPDSIKDAQIGQPFKCIPFDGCICVMLNAKNSFGAYAGHKATIAIFNGGRIQNFRESGGWDNCENMQPFPELNGAQTPHPVTRR